MEEVECSKEWDKEKIPTVHNLKTLLAQGCCVL